LDGVLRGQLSSNESRLWPQAVAPPPVASQRDANVTMIRSWSAYERISVKRA
jgi:hypothetical protein